MQTTKPRPVLVLQNDRANRHHTTVTVCLLTSTQTPATTFRIAVEPTVENGLDKPSIIQADRIFSYQAANLARRLGRLDTATMRSVDLAVRVWLDL